VRPRRTRPHRPARAAALAVAWISTVLCGAAAPAAATGAAGGRGPVVIVSATFGTEPIIDTGLLETLRFRLAADGYEPFIFYLPGGGLGDMAETAEGLVPFVDDVLARTGADSVPMIGYSQGGLLGRYYIRNLGGDAHVHSYVSLATPHYGMPILSISQLLGPLDCLGVPLCIQLQPGSDFLDALNAGDDTPGAGVRYTTFASRSDITVVPYTSAFLRSDGVTNVLLQDQCPLRVADHTLIAHDGAVYSGIVDAIEGRPIALDCHAP
jgi:triacylglycerol lipase